MNIRRVWTTCVVACVTTVIAAAPAWAQGPAGTARPPAGAVPAARPMPTGIAVIDLGVVFQNYSKFKNMKEAMKRDAIAADDRVKKVMDEINAMVKTLSELKKTDPQYKEMEEKIASRKAQVQADMAILKRDFAIQEAGIYYSTYQEIIDEVKLQADQRSVAVVLRVNNDEIDKEDPGSVMKALNKSVVWYRTIDLTKVVQDSLERRAGSTGGPAGTAPSALRPTGPGLK